MRLYWILLGCALALNALGQTRGDRFYALPPIVAPGAPLHSHLLRLRHDFPEVHAAGRLL